MPRDRPLNILQISTRDVAGGAERVAWDLFRSYRERGYGSELAVGYKRTGDPDVLRIPNARVVGRWRAYWWAGHQRWQSLYHRRVGRWLCRMSHNLAAPERIRDVRAGIEDFHYPGTWSVLDLPRRPPDILHAHNLHGQYFDLRALPFLSGRLPTVLTLHDAWLLSGHCAHSLDCTRWRDGCGQCPDLSLYPAVRRDATAFNWQRKQELFRQCRLHVAAPCDWLMRNVEASVLEPAIVESRVIPYGVDLATFRRGDRHVARSRLGIPPDAFVLLIAGNSIRQNPWKDYATVRKALAGLTGQCNGRRNLLIALGDSGPEDTTPDVSVRFVPFVDDPATVASYYQASDVYLHGARVDTFPCTVLEALSCGIPVIASAVGGIAEQIRSMSLDGGSAAGLRGIRPTEGATGILVPPGDVDAMVRAITLLHSNEDVRTSLGRNAECDALQRFDLKRHVNDYLQWYGIILDREARTTDRPPAVRVPASAAY